MFNRESDLQAAVHTQPSIVLSGIPEISPDYCDDVPSAISLGREIPLMSGPIDNLLIDANAILTFVECKRHGDSRLKREVYSQAINYASDFQQMFSHYVEDFYDQLFSLLGKAQGAAFPTLDELCDALSQDALLEGKNVSEWRRQFIARLKYNIQHGVFRVIILCGASPESRFSTSMVRNLMQIMTFAEKDSARYDLVLMDISEGNTEEEFLSRIIWRRYAALPQIPLFANASRDTSQGIENMIARRTKMAEHHPEQEKNLVAFLATLESNGYFVVENTQGLAVFKGNKSLYTRIQIKESAWYIIRRQIREKENLFHQIISKSIPEAINKYPFKIVKKGSSICDEMYEIHIKSTLEAPFDIELVKALTHAFISDQEPLTTKPSPECGGISL